MDKADRFVAESSTDAPEAVTAALERHAPTEPAITETIANAAVAEAAGEEGVETVAVATAAVAEASEARKAAATRRARGPNGKFAAAKVETSDAEPATATELPAVKTQDQRIAELEEQLAKYATEPKPAPVARQAAEPSVSASAADYVAEIEGRRKALGAKPVRPTREQFDFNDEKYEAAAADYEDARADWREEHAAINADERAYQRELKQAGARKQQAQREAFTTAENDLRAKHPDFDAVIAAAEKMVLPPHVGAYIRESSSAVAVGLCYLMAKDNAAEYRRIMALPPTRALVALADLEGELAAPVAEAPPARRISRAPSVPSHPNGGQATSRGNQSLEDGTYADYRKSRRQQQAARRGLTH